MELVRAFRNKTYHFLEIDHQENYNQGLRLTTIDDYQYIFARSREEEKEETPSEET